MDAWSVVYTGKERRKLRRKGAWSAGRWSYVKALPEARSCCDSRDCDCDWRGV